MLSLCFSLLTLTYLFSISFNFFNIVLELLSYGLQLLPLFHKFFVLFCSTKTKQTIIAITKFYTKINHHYNNWMLLSQPTTKIWKSSNETPKASTSITHSGSATVKLNRKLLLCYLSKYGEGSLYLYTNQLQSFYFWQMYMKSLNSNMQKLKCYLWAELL